MLDTGTIELFGEGINQYPYLKGGIQAILLIIAFIFLQNFLYGLTRLIAGER